MKRDIAAAVCAVAFVIVLAVSAVMDRSIRVLHVFEALPYIVAAILILRQNKFGYALGTVSGAFWLFTAGLRTTFIRNGFERLLAADWSRPDLLIAVPAALATGGLALFSIAGYARQGKRSRDAIVFAAALVLVPAFFIGIFAAFAPRFLGMFWAR